MQHMKRYIKFQGWIELPFVCEIFQGKLNDYSSQKHNYTAFKWCIKLNGINRNQWLCMHLFDWRSTPPHGRTAGAGFCGWSGVIRIESDLSRWSKIKAKKNGASSPPPEASTGGGGGKRSQTQTRTHTKGSVIRFEGATVETVGLRYSG